MKKFVIFLEKNKKAVAFISRIALVIGLFNLIIGVAILFFMAASAFYSVSSCDLFRIYFNLSNVSLVFLWTCSAWTVFFGIVGGEKFFIKQFSILFPFSEKVFEN